MPYSHIIGFDDAPFKRSYRGEVLVVGAVYAGLRLEGVVSGMVQRDGAEATEALVEMVSTSKFSEHLQLVMLQGITLAGFNVVDLHRLYHELDLPVLVVARREPDLEAIRAALLEHISGGSEKWTLIESVQPMKPLAGVYVQHVGLSTREAEELLQRTAVHGLIPEPLRAAHLIAGGVAAGESRGRT